MLRVAESKLKDKMKEEIESWRQRHIIQVCSRACALRQRMIRLYGKITNKT